MIIMIIYKGIFNFVVNRHEKTIAGILKNMTRIFLILFAIIISSSILAQHVNVSFKVINSKNEAIPYASVSVIKKGDSEHPQNKVADSSGLVNFSLLKEQYIVRITSA